MNEGTDHQPAEQRRIAHLDMDAFFAAVEQLDEPRYRGKAVIVGGLGPRGVVSTASYEARKFGVGSALPMARARKLCPQGIFLPPRFPRYREIAHQVRNILHEYTRVKQETGLTCSVGLAPNRFLAKLASELRKPNGLVIIDPDNVQQIIDPLPVRMIWGVGEVTERRLRSLGTSLISDLRRAPLSPVWRAGRMLRRLSLKDRQVPSPERPHSPRTSTQLLGSNNLSGI